MSRKTTSCDIAWLEANNLKGLHFLMTENNIRRMYELKQVRRLTRRAEAKFLFDMICTPDFPVTRIHDDLSP
jgi:hypothetical protein